MNRIFRKLGWMFQRSRKEAELRDELQFHLQEESEQAEDAGLMTERAKAAARRELGNITLLMEDTRATWGWTSLEPDSGRTCDTPFGCCAGTQGLPPRPFCRWRSVSAPIQRSSAC